MVKTRIAVLVSGGGTNLQALLDAQSAGQLPSGEIVLVIASNDKAFALQRAEEAGVPAVVCSLSQTLPFPTRTAVLNLPWPVTAKRSGISRKRSRAPIRQRWCCKEKPLPGCNGAVGKAFARQ